MLPGGNVAIARSISFGDNHFLDPAKRAFMPANSPLVGEVWSLPQDPPAHAVIVSELIGANGFQLMARNGRIINVTRSSLRQMWSYTGTSYTGPCSVEGCLLSAGVRFNDAWYCGSHVPRNQAVQLPGDAQVERPNEPVNGTLARCPKCHVDRDAQSAITLIEEVTVHRCSCRARWIAIMAQGTAEDGMHIGEDLQAAYDILESELCAPIEAFIGTTALAALRRLFTEIDGDNPRFAGVALTTSFAYGSNTVLVVGSPAASNDEDVEINGRLNTYWRHKERKGIIGRVISVEEASRGDRVVKLVCWAAPNEVMTMTDSALLRDYSPSESPTITTVNGTTHVAFPPEFVGKFPVEAPTVDLTLPELFETVQVADAADKRPIPGETWWDVNLGSAVQIYGIGSTTEGVEYVRTTTAEGLSCRLPTEDFLRYYAYDTADEVTIEIGGEYVTANGALWFIRSVTLPTIALENSEGVRKTVRMAEFRANYRRMIRRSAMDRLLDDEELV
jgi:hypothetical protein